MERSDEGVEREREGSPYSSEQFCPLQIVYSGIHCNTQFNTNIHILSGNVMFICEKRRRSHYHTNVIGNVMF